MEKINLKHLQSAINIIFQYVIEELEVKEIVLDESYYWSIDKDVLYNPNLDLNNDDIALGDLVEDLNSLNKLVESDENLSTTLHFKFAPSILRYLAESDEWFEDQR